MADTNLADISGSTFQDGTSIFTHLERGLTKNPDGQAVVVIHQGANHLVELITAGLKSQATTEGSECLNWTYAQLHGAALRFAAGLQAHGIEPGMRIATFIPNRVETSLTLWMSTLLRLTLCPLDPGATNGHREDELKAFLIRLKPDIIIALDAPAAMKIDAATKSLDCIPPNVKLILDGPAPPSWTTIVQLTASSKPTPSETETLLHGARNDDPNRICLILFTSGTSSGKPKGCPRPVASLTHMLHSQPWGEDFHIHSRALTSTANFRIISPYLHLAAWKDGACAVTPDPTAGTQGTIDAIRSQNITFLLFIPALLHAFISQIQNQNLDLTEIENVTFGGDMITRSLLLRTAQTFPRPTKLAVSHGMTEGGGFFSWPYNHTPAAEIPCFNNTICPLGTVSANVHLKIIDPDDTSKMMQKDQPGELVVSSPGTIKSYLDNTNADAFFTQEGEGRLWFRTGDLAVITSAPKDTVYIVGRIKDVIKRAGIPITPAALENCIADFTGSTTCVLGLPHELLGQVPFAVVEDLQGKTVEELKREVLDKFGKDYVLEGVATFQELGLKEWPLNATGKIMKLELVPRVTEYLEVSRSTLQGGN
ncbi:putative AMP-dependent synthetase/ligase, ANL domain, AMP-binding enzyme domain superfamily [Septoria linicola]|nr:putative AMP-dependent synthetase/ligase, ANL domain, AMP-binding enzyme domain superfamily [Septoria linicola]